MHWVESVNTSKRGLSDEHKTLLDWGAACSSVQDEIPGKGEKIIPWD